MVVKIKSKNKNVEERHLKELMKMCAWMEICGSIGHYVDFRVNYDGDGPAHLTFDFLGLDQNKYLEIKKGLLEDYDKNNKEPKVFSFD